MRSGANESAVEIQANDDLESLRQLTVGPSNRLPKSVPTLKENSRYVEASDYKCVIS